MTSFSSNPDVVIVGAGTSGLAAADQLQRAGIDVVVLEAAGHIGGRCYSDATLYEIPFDMGGSWLHSADINPLAKIAERRGVRLHKKPWSDCTWVTSNGQALPQESVDEYNRYVPKMWQAARDAGRGGADKPPIDVMPKSRWRETAKLLIAPMQGGDYDDTSVHDIARYDHTDEDWLVDGGLGAFVTGLFADVPVHLNCPVTAIDSSGPRVRVVTAKGTLRAKHVIITVSTGVLAADAIKFTPPLPDRKLAAIEQLPMGLLNKIGLDFDPAWQEAHQGDMADYHVGDEAFCTILFGFLDTSLAVGFVAGRFADQLEREGSNAATAFCLEALRNIFGNDVTKHVRGTNETRWRDTPGAVGAYSFARTKGAGSRSVLAEPIDDRLFFAGEATSATAYATVHGAYQTGLDVARQIIELGNR